MKKHIEKKKTRHARSRVWVIAAALATAITVAFGIAMLGASPTASAQPAGNQPQAEDNDVTVQFANQKIKIDPQTGKLRKPTAEEARAIMGTINGLTNRSSAGLQVTRQADGIRKIDLQGRYQTVVLAKPNPDGTNEVRCVTSAEEASQFLGIDPAKIPAKDK